MTNESVDNKTVRQSVATFDTTIESLSFLVFHVLVVQMMYVVVKQPDSCMLNHHPVTGLSPHHLRRNPLPLLELLELLGPLFSSCET